MVRMKHRYILSEIITGSDISRSVNDSVEGGKARIVVYPWKTNDIYQCIRKAVEASHGDYGLAMVQSSLSVKYLNAVTRIVLIRVRRGWHQSVLHAMSCINKIGNHSVFFRTLHIAGTIRSCEAFLVKFHFWQLPRLLEICSTEEEKLKVKDSLNKSLHNLQKHTITSTVATDNLRINSDVTL